MRRNTLSGCGNFQSRTSMYAPSSYPRPPRLARIFAVLPVVTGIRKSGSVWRAEVNIRSLHRTRNALNCSHLRRFNGLRRVYIKSSYNSAFNILYSNNTFSIINSLFY